MLDQIVSVGNDSEDGLLARLDHFKDDLMSSLSQNAVVTVDLSSIPNPDVRFAQIVESARNHAAGVGATVALAGPVDPCFVPILERAGFMTAEHPFWSQGSIAQ